MRTVRREQSYAAVAVSKRDQVLTEQSHSDRVRVRRRQLHGKRERLPEAAQQISHRTARPNPREQLIVGARQHSGSLPSYRSSVAGANSSSSSNRVTHRRRNSRRSAAASPWGSSRLSTVDLVAPHSAA